MTNKSQSNKPKNRTQNKAVKSSSSNRPVHSASQGRTSRTSQRSTVTVERQQRLSDSVKNEIIMTLTSLLSILIILSYFDLCGSVGRGIKMVLFGLMGVFTYVFPVVLFIMVAFTLSNKGNLLALQKIIVGFVMVILLTAGVQLIYGVDESRAFIEYFSYSAKQMRGGGILGAILCVPLHKAFGTVATAVILIALFLICVMLLSGKAIFAYIKRKSAESIEHSRERYKERESEFEKIEQKEINHEQEVRRMAKLVTIEPETDITINKKNRADRRKDALQKPLTKKKSIESNFDVEEIKPVIEPFTISGQVVEQKESTIYEEELKKKFGSAKAEEINHDLNLTNPMQMPEQKPESEQFEISEQESESAMKQSEKKIDPKKEVEQMAAMTEAMTEPVRQYVFPPISLLSRPRFGAKGMSKQDINATAETLQKTLESFGVHVRLVNVSCGPSVTRYELSPEQGVKVSSVTRLENDIKLNLAASDIRIEAPIPGKAAIGIEVPNSENSGVMLRDLVESKEFSEHSSDIVFAVGKDISGQIIVSDIAKMPHLLIAGATGSGKSVCINTLIMSILYKSSPQDVRLIMVDPKVVELSVYNGIPHLLIPVVTDPKKASAALNWAVMEMTNRYNKFAEMHVRDLKGYNEKVEEEPFKSDEKFSKLPQIVIIVDELADLMMVAPGEVEDAIRRLAQMARAAGLHLVIATQRPSVNVITGVIKANVPSRIAFAVSSNVDSRTIIDGSGAEKLLGKGDMLFYPSGYPKPVRVQGAFVSDKEVSAVVEYIKEKNQEPSYSDEVSNHISNSQAASVNGESGAQGMAPSGRDEYFVEAGRFIIEKDKASIGMLQRVYRIGFNRAARIMEQLAEAGVVGEEEGTKPRRIIMTKEQFEEYVDENC